MKLKNEEILIIIKGLSELEELKLPLNIKTSYILALTRQKLIPIVNLIQDKQVEIYKKYGKKTGRDQYKIPEEKIETAQLELNELLQVENELEITKLKLEDFGDNDIPFYIIEKLLLIINNE